MKEEAQGGEPLLLSLSRWQQSATGRGIIAAVIIFINITIIIITVGVKTGGSWVVGPELCV